MARADELTREEYVDGGRRLVEKLERYRPGVLAMVGIGAYRTAFNKPKAVVGAQAETLTGTRVWILPNPSGLNANYQLADFVDLFTELRRSLD
jgi:double-stranded uracil-DNA glycosylase